MHPDGPAVEIQPAGPAPEANGGRARPRTHERIEVDTLVRRVVQDSWSDRGRPVSVYAEPVIVESDVAGVRQIIDALLDRSLARTAEGNRVAVQVEWVDHGALLSVEDGMPGTDDEMSPLARALAEERGGWARVGRLPNGDAVFRVWLPQTASTGAPTARPA
jgi:signal transduction histidine kinase